MFSRMQIAACIRIALHKEKILMTGTLNHFDCDEIHAAQTENKSATSGIFFAAW